MTNYEYNSRGLVTDITWNVGTTGVADTPAVGFAYDNDGADADDEVLSESWFDGAGRVRRSRTEHPGSTGGWSATRTEYDILGRVKKQSVPTEVSVPNINDPNSWTPAGDDNRGLDGSGNPVWLWTHRKYDGMGRVVRKINTDGIDQETLNDSDILISYEGCGCAGGRVTTIEGEFITRTGSRFMDCWVKIRWATETARPLLLLFCENRRRSIGLINEF